MVVEWLGPTKYNKNEESKEIKADEEDDNSEEKENKLKDYLNTHKMLLELDNIDKEEKGKCESDENIEDENKLKEEYLNIKIDDVVRNENCLEENFNMKSTILQKDEVDNTDYSALECIKISLEKDLGDMLFASLYQIIDSNVIIYHKCRLTVMQKTAMTI